MRFSSLFAIGLTALLALSACAKSSDSSSEASSAPAASAAESAAPEASAEESAAPAASGGASAGQTVYTANCASCHQANGQGLTGSFPPLAGNPVVTGDPKAVIHIVKYGLTGKVAVAGQSFNGVMPPWGTQLSDQQIADVVTFVRSSWGNTASAVTADQVSAVKK